MNTELSTEEGNRLIAEFIGYFNEAMRHAERLKTGYKWQEDHVEIAALKYYTSWDWLMPVVEKIKKLKGDLLINIMMGSCYVHLKPPERGLCFFVTSKETIHAVWQAIVQFIQWYNKNKTPNDQ